MTSQKPRVLVLGANSRIGRIVAHHWQADPACPIDAISIARRGRVDHTWPGILVDPPAADVVLALWGVVPGQGDLGANTDLAIAAMELGAASGAARVLHCSSAAVYRPGSVPLLETDENMPDSAYGRAKRAMEQAVTDWSQAHPAGPRPCLMRIANVVGASSPFETLDTGGDVHLDRFADGQGPRRSYVGGRTLAQCFAALATCPLNALPAVVNLAAPPPLSMESLVRAAGRAVIWRSAPPEATPLVALDATRLRSLIDLPTLTPEVCVAEWNAQREDAQ